MTATEDRMREVARELLQSGKVACVIGYEQGPRSGVRPTFAFKAEDAQRLVWTPECRLNLVTYLRDFKQPARRGEAPPTIAVVVRPCDARAINLLMHEQQVKRENVVVIGVVCTETGDESRHACQVCHERVPVIYDVLIGEETKTESIADNYGDLAALEGQTAEQRLDYWLQEFDRCIRCYACRQACPGCYCFECVAEQVDPHWTSIAMQVPEKYFFHVMRAFHLAGRCVGCNACETVCPMDIPLSQLNRKLAKEVEALFRYRTGDDPETAPPLTTFDPQEALQL